MSAPANSNDAMDTAPEQFVMRDWALQYASRGFPVFPCKPDKRPYTAHGFKDATVDAMQITQWWSEHPDALIGMATGATSRVWVLDVDDPETFDAAGISLPATCRSKTGKGFHAFFQYDPAYPVRNLGRDDARPGTDVRGDGGYVILPPSLHPSGRRYVWDNALPAAPPPPDLLAMVTRRAAPTEAIPPLVPTMLRVVGDTDTQTGRDALDLACMAICVAKNGEQEQVLNRMALRMGHLVREGGLSHATARNRLIAQGCLMTSFDPQRPWTPALVAKKVDRALADGVASPVPAPLPSSGPIAATPYPWPEPASIPRRQWLFGRWLLRGEVSVILSPGGLGKSTLSVAIAVSLACGRNLLGLAPRERLGAWIYNLEDAPEELHRQIAATSIRHGVVEDECEGRLFVNSGIIMPLCTANEGKEGFVINEEAFAELTQTIQAQGISAVFVDPLVSSHRVSEASNEAMDALVKRWKRLAHETGSAVTLVHHTRKLAGREVTVEDGRGASALRDAARVVLLLNSMSQEEAAKLGVSEEQRRSMVRVDMGKASRSAGEDAVWFKLESQSLGNEWAHEPADHVGVAVRCEPPAPLAQLHALPIDVLQRRLGERDWRKDVQATDWVGVLIAEVSGLHPEANKALIKSLQAQLIGQGWLTIEPRMVKGKSNACPCIAIGKPFATTSHRELEVGGEGGEIDAA